jgi:uncharacterized protein YdeI (YjbR/CyaY-like superfamily)
LENYALFSVSSGVERFARPIRSAKAISLPAIPVGGIQGLIQAAVTLHSKTSAKPASRAGRLEMSATKVLMEALGAEPRVREHWSSRPPSCRREYLVWALRAKRAGTVQHRVAAVLEKLKAGHRMTRR